MRYLLGIVCIVFAGVMIHFTNDLQIREACGVLAVLCLCLLAVSRKNPV
jgi:hypothetical protein